MTTTISAKVFRRPLSHHSSPWLVDVIATSEDQIISLRYEAANSWPEAMQLAYKHRADIEAELMDEVHASRATRRDVHTVEATA